MRNTWAEEATIKLISEVGPVTYLEMAELLNIKPTCACERLNRFHKAGILHISSWTKGNRFHMARFDLLLTNDAPKPPPKDRNLCRKEWEERKREQGEWQKLCKRWEDRKKKKREKDLDLYLNFRRNKKIRYSTDLKKKDPILAALMGV